MMCHVTTVVSGAISLAVLAGVLSGVFYVVLVGVKWVGKLRLSLEEESVKGNRDENNQGEDDRCNKCGTRRRSTPSVSEHHHPCDLCSRTHNGHTGTCSSLRKRGSRSYHDDDDATSIRSNSEDITDEKTVKIREEIEKLVEKIIGGSLDGVSVGKLSKHPAYLRLFAKHHGSLCQGLARLGFALHFTSVNGNGLEMDSPRSAHAALKSLIEKVVAEAMKLPNIREILPSQNSTDDHGKSDDYSNKSYEDILATAILNKVVEQCQEHSDCGGVKKRRRRQAKGVRHLNNNDDSYKDYNSSIGRDDVDDRVSYNSDWSDTSRSEQLSLTIEEHIEEITTTYENSDEEEDVDDEEEDEVNDEIHMNGAIPFPESGRTIWNGTGVEAPDVRTADQSPATDIITATKSWEENWLFQKKRLRSRPNSHHPVPVPMLVPNPSQDFRALIGGVDADDLSDMSECSDSVLEDVVHTEEPDDENYVGDEPIEEVTEALVNGGGGGDSEATTTTTTTTDVDGTVTTDVIESPTSLNSESSCPSLSQKERDVSVDYEYIQKFDIELRDTSIPKTRQIQDCETLKEMETAPIKCRIAEREKDKWNHAVPMEDNPYSAENILKREKREAREYFPTGLHNSQNYVEFPSDSSPGIAREPHQYATYSRDYYVKASRRPTGDPNARKAQSTTDESSSLEGSSSTTDGVEKVEAIQREVEMDSSRTSSRRLIDFWEEGSVRERIAEKTSIMLPNVKELTKKFAKAIEDYSPKPSACPSVATGGFLNGSASVTDEKSDANSGIKSLASGPDADCETALSNVTVNIIPLKMSPASSSTSRLNPELSNGNEEPNEVMDEPVPDSLPVQSSTRDESTETAVETVSEPIAEGPNREIGKSSSVVISKLGGKEVHSLTARSISKEFREELRNNTSRRNLPRVDRGSSGESDHVEIVSESMRNRSPTPTIDMRSKRKFWEDLISNSRK